MLNNQAGQGGNQNQNQYPAGSKRQRFLGLVKATRDTYIPTIAGSISQLAAGASTRAFGDSNSYNEDGTLILPTDSKIVLYPSYTRLNESTGEFITEVRGWLYCPGVMNRKNRLMFTLARQLIKYNANVTQESTDQVINQLEDDNLSQSIYNPDSDKSSSSNSSASSFLDSPNGGVRTTSRASTVSNLNREETMKERLGNFIARSIPNVSIDIVIGAEDSSEADRVKTVKVTTDPNGRFEASIKTNYEPSVIHSAVSHDETVYNIQEVLRIQNRGISIISDIDDTIKLTGVIGDKRELLRSLLTKEVIEWDIPGVASWYQSLYREDIHFHYVSNSPWQLYPTIQKFFSTVNLPAGSIHLKQYTGNLLASILEPSRDRKRSVLEKVVRDFPHRQFVCIGDSGEHDLEAYIDLARKFPEQIKAIYIRVVPSSLSDLDDSRVLEDIREILNERLSQKTEIEKPAETSNTEESIPFDDDLIDLSDEPVKVKRGPMVPKKPTSLKGKQVVKASELARIEDSIELRPQLPPRTSTESTTSSKTPPAPPPPRRRTQTTSDRDLEPLESETNDPLKRTATDPIIMQSSQDDHGVMYNQVRLDDVYFYEMMDKKGEFWIRRIQEISRNLPNNIELKFWSNVDDILEDSYKKIDELKTKIKL